MVLQTTRYIVAGLLIAVLGSFSAASVILFTDPFNARMHVFLLFYASMFMAILGFCVSLGVAARHKFTAEPATSYLTPSIRQGCFIALFLMISLLLQSERLLYWWVESSILLFFVFVEIFLNL